jgi:recombination protein RecR
LTDLFPFAGETTPDCGVAARRGSGSDFLLSTTPALRATPSPAKGNNCEFCRDPSRANGQLCLVRDLGDVWTLEKSGVFRGRYHILGGLLGGAAGLTPEDLNIASLPARIEAEEITEIIFVLPNTVEGKTTQHYIMQSLEFRVQSSDNSETALCTLNSKLSFTELASGVPLGGDLDYIDDGTLSLAFGRREKI